MWLAAAVFLTQIKCIIIGNQPLPHQILPHICLPFSSNSKLT